MTGRARQRTKLVRGKPQKRRVRRATEIISQVVQNARYVINMGRHPTVFLKVQITAQEVAETFRGRKTIP